MPNRFAVFPDGPPPLPMRSPGEVVVGGPWTLRYKAVPGECGERGGFSATGGGVGSGEDGGSRGRELHHGGELLERRREQGAVWESMFYASVVRKGLRVGGLGPKAPSLTEGPPHAPDLGLQLDVRVA